MDFGSWVFDPFPRGFDIPFICGDTGDYVLEDFIVKGLGCDTVKALPHVYTIDYKLTQSLLHFPRDGGLHIIGTSTTMCTYDSAGVCGDMALTDMHRARGKKIV